MGGADRDACDRFSKALKNAVGPFKSMNGRSLVVTKDHS
jgi:hypothetical protein